MNKLVLVMMITISFFTSSLAVEYQMRVLPKIPGTVDSTAYGINDSGIIVGYTTINGPRIAKWQDETCEFVGESIGYANGINNNGDIVGICNYQTNMCDTGFKYSNNTMSYLGANRLTNAINDSGWIAGVSYGSAKVWDPSGRMIDLSGNNNQAWDINNNLQLVGCETPGGPAVRWTINQQTFLNTKEYYQSLPNTNSSIAYSINDSGSTAGISGGHACLWISISSTPIDLFSGFTNRCNGLAWSINEKNQVVGYIVDETKYPNKSHAFYWDAVTGLSLLPDFDAKGSQAFSINANGQIVGYAEFQTNQNTTVVKAICWEPVPEPSSFYFVTLCLFGYIAYKKRVK